MNITPTSYAWPKNMIVDAIQLWDMSEEEREHYIATYPDLESEAFKTRIESYMDRMEGGRSTNIVLMLYRQGHTLANTAKFYGRDEKFIVELVEGYLDHTFDRLALEGMRYWVGDEAYSPKLIQVLHRLKIKDKMVMLNWLVSRGCIDISSLSRARSEKINEPDRVPRRYINALLYGMEDYNVDIEHMFGWIDLIPYYMSRATMQVRAYYDDGINSRGSHSFSVSLVAYPPRNREDVYAEKLYQTVDNIRWQANVTKAEVDKYVLKCLLSKGREDFYDDF